MGLPHGTLPSQCLGPAWRRQARSLAADQAAVRRPCTPALPFTWPAPVDSKSNRASPTPVTRNALFHVRLDEAVIPVRSPVENVHLLSLCIGEDEKAMVQQLHLQDGLFNVHGLHCKTL